MTTFQKGSLDERRLVLLMRLTFFSEYPIHPNHEPKRDLSHLPLKLTYLHHSAHVRDHDSIFIVIELLQERHFGVNSKGLARLCALWHIDFVQVLLGKGEIRAANRRVFLVQIDFASAFRMRDEEIERVCV